jgi:uncharacterized secreted protein with C-terminal beta-propeller domain
MTAIRRLTGLALLSAVLLLAAATVDASAAPRLRSFSSCQALLHYVKARAARVVGPSGLGGPIAVGAPEAGADAARPGVDYSTTNVQEAGVDEPDVVKTDGKTIFALAAGKLWSIDVTGPRQRVADSLQLENLFGAQLLLDGDRLLVLSGGGPVPILEGGVSILPIRIGTVLTEIDVGDPSRLRVVRTLSVAGSLLAARLTGSTARVVIASTPAIEFPPVPEGIDPIVRNREVIASSRVRNWLPSYRLRNARTGRTRTRVALGCDDVRRPPVFSGLGTITVFTIDLRKGLEPVDTDAVMTDGQTVYASTRRLYVATQKWLAPAAELPDETVTEIHAFDVADTGTTAYRGSGAVPGWLIGQFAMSEQDGYLRVASTEMPPWGTGDTSRSLVTVLDETSAGNLAQVGQVGGLGRGERIYAVRFVGDAGYVVTFRQVDPLYVVDLSDPRRPAVRGELKIAGYSAYLHPLGGGLLLGVGQDADAGGRVLGTQVSLFDVSDPSRPARLDRQLLGQGWSDAEFDHHAFLWWPASKLAVLPFSGGSFTGAVGLRVGRDLRMAGTVAHGAAPVRRALVVGDTLYTLSDAGVLASSLGALSARSWLPLG